LRSHYVTLYQKAQKKAIKIIGCSEFQGNTLKQRWVHNVRTCLCFVKRHSKGHCS